MGVGRWGGRACHTTGCGRAERGLRAAPPALLAPIPHLSTLLSQLLDDLHRHVHLLGTPERAAAALAAAQSPLLGDRAAAGVLIPRLCNTILLAPDACRRLLVRWWAAYPADLLRDRVVAPLQASKRGGPRGWGWQLACAGGLGTRRARTPANRPPHPPPALRLRPT